MRRHLSVALMLQPTPEGYDWKLYLGTTGRSIEGAAPNGREALRAAFGAALEHGPALLDESEPEPHHARLVKTLGDDEVTGVQCRECGADATTCRHAKETT